MSEIIETVKDTITSKAGGKKKAVLWGFAAVAVAGVALFVGSRRSATASGETSGTGATSVTTGTPTSGVTAADLENVVAGVGSEIDRLDARFDSLDSATSTALDTLTKSTSAAITQQQTALTSTVSAFTERLRSTENRLEEHTIAQPVTTAAVAPVASTTPVVADRLAEQVAAYTKIRDLGAAFKTATTAAQRDALHAQANAIGIAAGFGDGGVDGSKRVIPNEVLQAAATAPKG